MKHAIIGLALLAAVSTAWADEDYGQERRRDRSATEHTTRDNRGFTKGDQDAPRLEARLLDEKRHASHGSAVVQVDVKGIELIDPDKVGEEFARGQGHLHYKVDDGPVIASPQPKLSVHGLQPGRHAISVMLVGSDHSPLGPAETLSLTIPDERGGKE